MSERRYLIRGDESEFYAGSTSDGRQVIMGSHSPTHVRAIFFDRGGRLLNCQLRELSSVPVIVGDNPHDPDRVAKLQAALKEWQTELNFTPGPIEVARFDCMGARIDDLPTHYEDFLASPADTEPDKKKWPEWRSLIQRWKDRGMYVLWWGKDYWMDGDGNVEST